MHPTIDWNPIRMRHRAAISHFYRGNLPLVGNGKEEYVEFAFGSTIKSDGLIQTKRRALDKLRSHYSALNDTEGARTAATIADQLRKSCAAKRRSGDPNVSVS